MGNGMNKIIPGLYLGNFRDAKDQNQLSNNGITHIISIHESPKPFFMDKKYLCIVASDTSGQNISQHFSQTNDFIHEARITGGNVLVHCLAGVSRSTTVVIAYLMTVTGFPWRDCFAAVQLSRSCASPNFGFQRQLLEFQYENMIQEQQRLIEKFPDSKDSISRDAEEVQSIIEAFKKQQKEKEILRQEAREIINQSFSTEMTTSNSSETKKEDISQLKTDQRDDIKPASCQEILSNLDSLVSE